MIFVPTKYHHYAHQYYVHFDTPLILKNVHTIAIPTSNQCSHNKKCTHNKLFYIKIMAV